MVVCKPILVFHFGPNRPGFKLLTLDLDQAEQYWLPAVPSHTVGSVRCSKLEVRAAKKNYGSQDLKITLSISFGGFLV